MFWDGAASESRPSVWRGEGSPHLAAAQGSGGAEWRSRRLTRRPPGGAQAPLQAWVPTHLEGIVLSAVSQMGKDFTHMWNIK